MKYFHNLDLAEKNLKLTLLSYASTVKTVKVITNIIKKTGLFVSLEVCFYLQTNTKFT